MEEAIRREWESEYGIVDAPTVMSRSVKYLGTFRRAPSRGVASQRLAETSTGLVPGEPDRRGVNWCLVWCCQAFFNLELQRVQRELLRVYSTEHGRTWVPLRRSWPTTASEQANHCAASDSINFPGVDGQLDFAPTRLKRDAPQATMSRIFSFHHGYRTTTQDLLEF